MNTDKLATVDERARGRVSVIWILPLIAALLGGWLIYKSIIEAPIEIVVYFDSGEGIEEGKTEVRYEGLKIGQVKAVTIQPQLVGIIAVIEMDQRTVPAMLENTQFWLVKPEISLAGIKGLSTVLSGNYITMRIGDGAPQTTFNALSSPPPRAMTEAGLHLTLKSADLGSIAAGSPLIYKKMTIGDVESFQLDKDGLGVSIDIFIEPEFAHLVKADSRFWNASGISLKGGLTGFDIRTESFVSMLKGGIALTEVNTQSGARVAKNSDEFTLYDDYVAAQSGVAVMVEFPISGGIQAGITKVKYKGLVVGVVEDVEVGNGLSSMKAKISLDPLTVQYLNEGTRIWLARPKISLKELSGLSNIISGSFINIDFDGKESQHSRAFVALKKPPLLINKEAPGLHLTLSVKSLQSIDRGTEILYRHVNVGSVVDYQLSADTKSINVNIHIKPEHVGLVNKSSRFWDASGIEIKGGVGGLNIRTGSIVSILQGGIAFYTPDTKAEKVVNGSRFPLFDDYDTAHVRGATITLHFEDGEGLSKGTSIKYEGIEVGVVETVALNKDMNGVVVTAILYPSANNVAREETLFWLVRPELGLAKTANLSTLLTGQYITFRIGGGAKKYSFDATLSPPLAKTSSTGLNFILTSSRLGSIKEGVSVYYREVAVGKVTGYRLADTADYVQIYVNVEEKYAPLVRVNSKFWNASGLDFGFKLFGGAKIKTESLESMLAGGISFATPDGENMGAKIEAGTSLTLHQSRKDAWLKWQAKIPLL